MRIKVIIPNASKEFLESQLEERRRAAGPGVEVEVVCLREGPVSLEGAVDEALVGPPLLAEALKAQAEGFDAVVIDCAADPALSAVREAIDVPVVSAGEAAFLYALGLGDRFSVVTVLENTAGVIQEKLKAYGLGSRVASVRYADVPVLALEDTAKAGAAILAEARAAIDEDGAEVIVLGCTGMSPVARFLQENLEVPVVDPAAAALSLAEAWVRMGLRHSRKRYPVPPSKEVKGEQFAKWGLDKLGNKTTRKEEGI